ncbi:serine-threonine protein kinase, partial [Entamoeba invadens IP1]
MLSLLPLFVTIFGALSEPSFHCYNPVNRTILMYFNTEKGKFDCLPLPPTVRVDWVGTDDFGGTYYIGNGTADYIGSTTLSIVQMSRSNNSVNVDCKNPIIFEAGHGLTNMTLVDYGDRTYWSFDNKNLPEGFGFEFKKKPLVWAPTTLNVTSKSTVYMIADDYMYYHIYKNESDAFIYYEGLSDVSGSIPFVRTHRYDDTSYDCVYQFSSKVLLMPDVSDSNFKMINVCERRNVTRYLQCFWSKGQFTDCTCKSTTHEKTLKTSNGLNYPDCLHLSKLYDLGLNYENTQLLIDTPLTATWNDFVIPQRMESLTVDFDTEKVNKEDQVLFIDNDFSLPTFPFTVNGGFIVNGVLTIETAAEYSFDELFCQEISVDSLVEANVIIFSSKVNLTVKEKLVSQGLVSVCGADGETQRWVKKAESQLVSCGCRVTDDNSFSEFDCNRTSLEKASQLELMMSRSEYNGQHFDRYWKAILFEGSGKRTLSGKSHTITTCAFQSSNKEYAINTNLMCTNTEINSGVSIEVNGAFQTKSLTIKGDFLKTNDAPIFRANSSMFNELNDITVEQMTSSSTECINLVLFTQKQEEVTSRVVGEYTLFSTDQILRLCPTNHIDTSITCEVTKDGTFVLPQCPCQGTNCVVEVPESVSVVSNKIIDSSFTGTLKINGDVTIDSVEFIQQLLTTQSAILTFSNSEHLTVESLQTSGETLIVSKIKLSITHAANRFSIKSEGEVTFLNGDVLIDTIYETENGKIYIAENVNKVDITKVVSSSIPQVEVITLLPSSSVLTLNRPPFFIDETTTENRVVAFTKNRKIAGKSECDNQARLSQEPTSSSIDCKSLNLNEHKCYYSQNGFFVEKGEHPDVSCPCNTDSAVQCSIEVFESPSTLEVTSNLTTLIINTDLTITSSAKTFTLKASSAVKTVTIVGSNNLLILDTEKGLLLNVPKDNLLTISPNQLWNGFALPKVSSPNGLKLATSVVTIISSEEAMCTIGSTTDSGFVCLQCGTVGVVDGACAQIDQCKIVYTNTKDIFCALCQDGYAPTSDRTSCKACSSLCLTCEFTKADASSPETEKCLKCKSGYKEVNGVCTPFTDQCSYYLNQKCVKCPSKYSSNGVSDSCTQNCAENCLECAITDNTICIICDTTHGYQLSGGKCVKPIGSSAVSNANSISCSDMFYIQNGVCGTCGTNCSSCDSSECYSCSTSDGVLSKSQCVSDSGCTQTYENRCISCGPKKYFKDGKCMDMDSMSCVCHPTDYVMRETACQSKS